MSTSPDAEISSQTATQQALDLNELEQFCVELASSVDVDGITQGGMKKIEERVESMLQRLDEFGESLDQTRVQTQQLQESVLPQLQILAKHLDVLFRKIDSIQQYVQLVSTKVQDLDRKTTELEKQQGTTALKTAASRFLPKFLLGGSSQTGSSVSTQPAISFQSTDYFVHPSILISSMNKNLKAAGYPTVQPSIAYAPAQTTADSSATQSRVIQKPSRISTSSPAGSYGVVGESGASPASSVASDSTGFTPSSATGVGASSAIYSYGQIETGEADVTSPPDLASPQNASQPSLATQNSLVDVTVNSQVDSEASSQAVEAKATSAITSGEEDEGGFVGGEEAEEDEGGFFGEGEEAEDE